MCMKFDCKCELKVVGHVHAELMKQYAEDARETNKPWERWEFLSTNVGWAELSGHPFWEANVQYRRKPHTHVVNGIEVPAPMRDEPKYEQTYWVADPGNREFVCNFDWCGDDFDRRHLERGLVHATKEAAVANALAMIGRKVP